MLSSADSMSRFPSPTDGPRPPSSHKAVVRLNHRIHVGERNTIVVVDDEADIVEAMTMLLESQFPSAHVLGTQSPQEALDHVKGAHLLVTDYRMPVMDGLELARRAQKADGQ